MDRVLVFGGGSTPGGMLPLFPRSGAGWRQLDRWKRGFRHELAFQFIASLRDMRRVSKIRNCDIHQIIARRTPNNPLHTNIFSPIRRTTRFL